MNLDSWIRVALPVPQFTATSARSSAPIARGDCSRMGFIVTRRARRRARFYLSAQEKYVCAGRVGLAPDEGAELAEKASLFAQRWE